MEGPVIKTIMSEAGDRKLDIFRRDNGTFGFEEFFFDFEEKARCPVRGQSYAIVDTVERATAEGMARVSWRARDSSSYAIVRRPA